MLNAVAYANVVPRLPAIKSDLSLSDTALGTAVAAMPVGALLAGPLGGVLIARHGSKRVVLACGVVLGLIVPYLALAPNWPGLAGAFLVLGATDSLMDVSMNAHAMRVQRGYGRSIINSLHGLWSVGAVIGGVGGTLAAGVDLSLEVHLAVVGAVVVVVAASLRSWLLPGLDPHPDDVGADAANGPQPGGRRVQRLLVLGVLVVLAAAIEDTPASWGAVFLRNELATAAAVAGLAYIGFQVFMTAGRLAGDRLVDRFGEVAMVRAGGVLIAAGMGMGLAIDTPVAVIIGFSVAGLGAAPLFPLVFNAAANVPGVSTGHGVAAIAWMGRIGFLLAPPIVGLIGDSISLRAGLTIAPAAGVVVAMLAPLLRTRVAE